jgi:hypothetical protein
MLSQCLFDIMQNYFLSSDILFYCDKDLTGVIFLSVAKFMHGRKTER